MSVFTWLDLNFGSTSVSKTVSRTPGISSDSPFYGGYDAYNIYFVYNPELDQQLQTYMTAIAQQCYSFSGGYFDTNAFLSLAQAYVTNPNYYMQQSRSDTMYVVTGVTVSSDWTCALKVSSTPLRPTDPNGIYSKEDYDRLSAPRHINISYYCLAMCYEKALAVKALLAAQVSAIEEINEQIRTNNDFLIKANKYYEDYYKLASDKDWKGTSAGGNSYYHPEIGSLTADAYKVGSTTLDSYAVNTCGCSIPYTNSYAAAQYTNVDGEFRPSGDAKWDNIDTHEQGCLTGISNMQESIRMYGDELSTDAQVLNTKLTQIMQNYNSFLNIATQLAKSTGEYFKSIASNVR
jgi:hypothetical protein